MPEKMRYTGDLIRDIEIARSRYRKSRRRLFWIGAGWIALSILTAAAAHYANSGFLFWFDLSVAAADFSIAIFLYIQTWLKFPRL